MLPVTGKPPFQFHAPECSREKNLRFTLNIVRYGYQNAHVECCRCSKSRMKEIIDLIDQICFKSNDASLRFFFYLPHGESVDPQHVVSERIEPTYRVLTVEVSTVVTEDEGQGNIPIGKVLVSTTPPVPIDKSNSSADDDGISETSAEGSDQGEL